MKDELTPCTTAHDKEKLRAIADHVRAIPFPIFSTDAAIALLPKLVEQRRKFAAWVDSLADSL